MSRTTDPALSAALRAVVDAAVVCRFVQARLDTLRAMTKDDQSPVTVADFASQALVARALKARLDRPTLVAEESADVLRQQHHSAHLDAVTAALRDSGAWPGVSTGEVLDAVGAGAGEPDAAAHERGFFTLDPIDGTKGFLRNQQYCVSLGFIRRGVVEFGVIACPNLALAPASGQDPADTDPRGSLYSATFDGPALARPLDRPDAEPIVLSRPDVPAGSPARLAESVESAHTSHSRSAELMAMAGPTHEPVRLDSQAKYCLVAAGRADAYLRLPSKKGYVERIWDHAAGHLVAVRAGCVASDVHGRPLDFSRGRGLEANQGVIVAPPALHARLLTALAKTAPR